MSEMDWSAWVRSWPCIDNKCDGNGTIDRGTYPEQCQFCDEREKLAIHIERLQSQLDRARETIDQAAQKAQQLVVERDQWKEYADAGLESYKKDQAEISRITASLDTFRERWKAEQAMRVAAEARLGSGRSLLELVEKGMEAHNTLPWMRGQIQEWFKVETGEHVCSCWNADGYCDICGTDGRARAEEGQ